jgi:lipopolysaccharide biosynthesis regulator YciM
METVFERLVAARRERNRLAAQLDQLDELIQAIEAEALETMVAAGLQSVRTADGATIYIEEAIYARPAAGHEDDLIVALQTNGMADLVRPRVMPQTLSAAVRELLRSDGELPGWLEPWVAVHRQQRVKVRGA